MTKMWTSAAVLGATLALASCSGNPYQGAGAETGVYENQEFDTNWILAGLALAILFAISAD